MDSAALRALPASALMESLMVPGLSPGLAELLELIRLGRAPLLSGCADTISAGERGLHMRFSDLSAERFDLLRCTPTGVTVACPTLETPSSAGVDPKEAHALRNLSPRMGHRIP